MKEKELSQLDPFVLCGNSPPNADQTVSQNHLDTNGSQETHKQIGEWLTAEEAACYIRCSIKTLYNHKYNGSIRGHNSGGKKKGKLLFKKSDLDAFITGKRGV